LILNLLIFAPISTVNPPPIDGLTKRTIKGLALFPN
jgi:hypothetical protein